MGCAFSSNKNITINNEISLTPIPRPPPRKTETDTKLKEKSNSKNVYNNNTERLINNSSLNYGPVKYLIQFSNGKKVEIKPYQINLLIKVVRGFLFRKKYEEYIKTQLMDQANELYFQFIISTKNYLSSKVLNNKKNEKIKKILKTSWNEFYTNDPTLLLKKKLNQIHKYPNGLIIKYKNKNFIDQDDQLNNIEYCYKGSVDIYTNKKNGYGELIYIDGRQYIGTFYKDEFCGWNTLVNNNGIIYVGLFNHDMLDGKGLNYNTTNDYIYRGDFKDFKKSGYGEEMSEGVKYIGEFDNDEKSGQGELILQNKNRYKGMFVNDKFNGKGEYKWNDINKEYKGNFVDGKMHGNGLLIWEDKYYKGCFVNGVKEGKAEFGFVNGCKFFFNFKNNLPCGKGYIQDNNNKINEVYYNQGKIIDKNMNEIVFLFQ